MAKGNNPVLKTLSGKLGEYVVANVFGHTVLRAKPKKKTTSSALQLVQQGQLGRLATIFKGLDAVSQDGFRLLGKTMIDPTGKRMRPGMTPNQCFISINSFLRSIGQAIVTTAPSVPAVLPYIGGNLTLTATLNADGSCTLTLYASSVTNYYVQLQSANGTLPSAPCPQRLLTLETYGLLAAGDTDLSAAYAARVKTAPRVGERVWLKLVPYTTSGVRGIAEVISAEVQSASAQANGDDTRQKAA